MTTSKMPSVTYTPLIFGENEVLFHWFFKGNLVLLLLTFTTLLSAQTDVNNIMPVGRICVAGQACVGVPAGATSDPITEEVRSDTIADASVLSGAADQPESSAEANPISSSTGETYEVQMRNQGTDGVMVFEPSVLRIEVGDSVTFKATDAGHNSASIEGMIPSGAPAWDGSMSEDITITFTEEGTYVYQCTPHLMMAMVGVIAVGDLSKNIDEISNVAAEKKSEFVMEQDRLDSYLQSLK